MHSNNRAQLALLCLLATVGVTTTLSAASDQSVPFLATFSGTAQFVPPDAPTSALFTGSGYATHLGASTNIGVLAPLAFVPTTDCPLGVGIPHVNMETLTAANGDQLVLEMNDLACPIDETFLVFAGAGEWEIVHGTGRFSGATGSGTVSGGGNFIEGTFEFNLVGQISYNPAKD